MGKILSYIFKKHGKIFQENQQILKIKDTFRLTDEHISQFYYHFNKLDVQSSNYIQLNDFYQFIEQEKDSLIAFYLERFYQLIEKNNSNKVCFIEFVISIAAYCLFTQQNIIRFVFQMIDDDDDGIISKKDILYFMLTQRFNKILFSRNFIQVIDQTEIDRSDQINFDSFKKLSKKLSFICYPGFKMQEIFRNKIMGKTFWIQLFNQLQLKQSQLKNLNNKDKMVQQYKKKQGIKIKHKIQKIQVFFKKNKIQTNMFKPQLFKRKPFRRSSDSNIIIQPQNIYVRKSNSNLYIKDKKLLKKHQQSQINQINTIN